MLKSLLIVLCLLFAAPAFGVVTAGNTSVADTGASTTETGLTWSHNSNGDGLLVGLSFYVWGGSNTYGESACTVAYNGIAMTKVGGFGHGSDDGQAVESWKLAAPTAGANNVVVTCAVAVIMSGGGLSVSNAHQTAMTGTVGVVDSGFSLNPSATVSSATGGLVLGVVSARPAFTACAAGTDETEIWETIPTSGGANSRACGFTQAGAASVTIEPTLSPDAGDYRSMLVVPINEASVVPSPRQRSVMILP